jgi:hypothetical protein
VYTLKISDYTENSNFLPQSRENTPSRPPTRRVRPRHHRTRSGGACGGGCLENKQRVALGREYAAKRRVQHVDKKG